MRLFQRWLDPTKDDSNRCCFPNILSRTVKDSLRDVQEFLLSNDQRERKRNGKERKRGWWREWKKQIAIGQWATAYQLRHHWPIDEKSPFLVTGTPGAESALKKKEKKDTWHHTWDFLSIIWDPRNIPWLIPMDEMLPFLVTSIITNISGTNSTLKRDIWISHHICLLWDALRCSEIHRVRGSFGAHWRKRGCSC